MVVCSARRRGVRRPPRDSAVFVRTASDSAAAVGHSVDPARWQGLLDEVAARIAAGRKEREIDPAVEALRACVVDAADDPTMSAVASKRLKEMLAFTELVDRWYVQMLNVPRPRLVALIKLGEKIINFLPGKSK